MPKRVQYPQNTSLNPEWVKQQIEHFKSEDMPDGDITTELTVKEDSIAQAKLIAMEPFIFCGASIFPYSFPENCDTKLQFNDGDQLQKGTVIAVINGPANMILSYERLTLNLLQRLCGIATETYRFTQLNLPENFKVLDTRKTTPGLRQFEKYAVTVGGGSNHRLNLSTGILIKDNHLESAGGVKNAVVRAKSGNNSGLPIELEVDTLDQLKSGLEADVDGYLLDNMSPETVKEAVELIRSTDGGEDIFVEASGGINYKTIEMYAHTGIDAVSMSAITLQAQPVDIKLEFD